MDTTGSRARVALIEAGSPGLNIYSHVAMGRGLLILATVLKHEGMDVRAYVEDISGKGTVDWDYVAAADVIGFSSITCTLTRTAELVTQARAVNPDAVIVFGGPEPTCAPERAFEAGADYVIRGEAEFTLPRFVRTVVGEQDGGVRAGDPGTAIRKIPGIVWRQDGELEFGPPHVQLTRAEVDALPLIDTSLVYRYRNRTTGVVWRSRGCPERCGFCEVHQIWPRYVLRDESRSVEELMRCQSEERGVFLIDDNSAANKQSFKRFLRDAIERGYRQPIAVQLRADAVFERDGRLDRELLRLLRDLAPFTVLCVGVESASDDDLAEIGKHDTAENMARALKAMRRCGLLVHGMLIAFANDTAETLKRNGAFARKHLTSLQYLFETPLPGTDRTAEHEAEGRVMWHALEHLRFLDGMHIAVQPVHMTAPEMQQVVMREYLRFYSRARLIRAFVVGLFVRNRRLSVPQRIHVASLRGWQRVRGYVWLHLQYKFAPWALLRIGRQRVLQALRDSEYLAYLKLLDAETPTP